MTEDQKRKSRLVPALFGAAVGALLGFVSTQAFDIAVWLGMLVGALFGFLLGALFRYGGLEFFWFWPS